MLAWPACSIAWPIKSWNGVPVNSYKDSTIMNWLGMIYCFAHTSLWSSKVSQTSGVGPERTRSSPHRNVKKGLKSTRWKSVTSDNIISSMYYLLVCQRSWLSSSAKGSSLRIPGGSGDCSSGSYTQHAVSAYGLQLKKLIKHLKLKTYPTPDLQTFGVHCQALRGFSQQIVPLPTTDF